MSALLAFGMVGNRDNPAPLTDLQQKTIEGVEAQHLSATGPGDALSATNNPPAYYYLQAAVYKLMPSGRVLDKLAAMRCLSALMGALTVLLVFMFLRELLPATPRAWTAGALLVAFQPLFGFISAGVNNDNLLYLAAAGTLWGVARSFRRGLTPANGALLGGFLGLGLVSKLTLLGFVPAVLLALALLLIRDVRGDRRGALTGAATALSLSLGPVLVYLLLNHFAWHRGFIPGGVGGFSTPVANPRHFSFDEEVSHVWQLFLPRLWLRPQFSSYPLWTTWFVGFVGRFGWQDYTFPYWFYDVARVLTVGVLALAAVELVRRRAAVRRRLGELAVYVAAVLGLCVEIGIQSYRYLVANGLIFEQARYLLPLLGLYGAIGALAVRAGGRRWGRSAGGRAGAPGDRPRPLRAGDHDRPLLLMSEVSVAIPVLNGGVMLEGVLAALARQTVGHELIVCDSGSTDGSVQLARANGAQVLEIPTAHFSHGGTRNLLMERASGQRVAFLTHDAEPADERWLERLLARPRARPRRGDRVRALPASARRPGGRADRTRALVSFAVGGRAPERGAALAAGAHRAAHARAGRATRLLHRRQLLHLPRGVDAGAVPRGPLR